MRTWHKTAAAALLCAALAAPARTEEVFVPAPPSGVMPVGERLRYRITWLGIPVGTGELWAKEKALLDGRELVHVVGVIETNKVLSKIFPMHDEAHSWIDPRTFESAAFEKKVDELLLKQHEQTLFDRVSGRARFRSFRTDERKEFPVSVPVHDLLSVSYWARRQPLEPGQAAYMGFSCDQKDWFLEVKALRREKVKIGGRKVDTIKIEPNTWVGGIVRRGLAAFNVTDDAARVPVRITFKAPFGRVSGTLVTD